MNRNERDYLIRLFASSSDATDETEVDFPMVEVPETLSHKLHVISESTPVGANSIKQSVFKSWPNMVAVASGLLMAMLALQMYQQQKTLNQLEQAQADLATALHYLGEANRITRAQVRNSVNDNMKKAGVRPAMKIGRDVINLNLKEREDENRIPNRTL